MKVTGGEAGFTGDLQGVVETLRKDLRWLKGVIGATGLAVLADLVIGLFL